MLLLTVNDTGHAMISQTSEGQSSLDALQTLVDGLVDVVTTSIAGLPFDVWVNDEGAFRNDMRINTPMSILLGRTIYGPAVISTSDENGETTGLVNDHARILSPTLAALGCALCVCASGETVDGMTERAALELALDFDPDAVYDEIASAGMTLSYFLADEARLLCSLLSARSAELGNDLP